jgi:hypothetical protein
MRFKLYGEHSIGFRSSCLGWDNFDNNSSLFHSKQQELKSFSAAFAQATACQESKSK